jgi:ribose 5-phosphate isomerase B
MRIAVGCDHRGYEGKRLLAPLLRKWGHEIRDFGCDSINACDYPDYASAVARAVATGEFDVGILLDGSGIGMSVAANKVCGIRAALVHDEVTARLAREYNHCNVLCIGTDLLSYELMRKITEIFLTSTFAEGRHSRRVAKICQIEADSAAAAALARHTANPAPTPAATPVTVGIVHGHRAIGATR